MNMICSDNSKYYFPFSVMGKAFKKEAKSVSDLLANLSLEDITTFESELESKGEFQLNDSVKITKDMVQVKRQTKQVLILNNFGFIVCKGLFSSFLFIHILHSFIIRYIIVEPGLRRPALRVFS